VSTVQSIERAFSILDAVAKADEGLSVSEAARQLGLPKSTVSRLIITLELLGAVERLKNERVRIGQRLFNMTSSTPLSKRLQSLARPYLESLAASIGEDAALVIPEGNEAHFIDQVSGGQVIQVQDWTGSKFPMHTLTAGKLFLAFQAREKLEAYLKQPLSALTRKTVTDPDTLVEQLQTVAKQGYCWSYGEFADDLNAVSSPIFAQNKIIACLTLYGPSFRFPAQNQAAITDTIVASCQDISAAL
jgi:DNA-binding IclR family transcriptional regulator